MGYWLGWTAQDAEGQGGVMHWLLGRTRSVCCWLPWRWCETCDDSIMSICINSSANCTGRVQIFSSLTWSPLQTLQGHLYGVRSCLSSPPSHRRPHIFRFGQSRFPQRTSWALEQIKVVPIFFVFALGSPLWLPSHTYSDCGLGMANRKEDCSIRTTD